MESYGTLHTNVLRVRCIFKSLACIGACLKSAPKTHLPIEMNGKCIKNASKTHCGFIFGVLFESHVHVSQVHIGVRQPENAPKTHTNASKTHMEQCERTLNHSTVHLF